MENISIDILSDYLADSVLKHYKSKCKDSLAKAIFNVESYEQARKDFDLVKQSIDQGVCLDVEHVKFSEKEFNDKSKLIQEDWNQQALNLNCVYATVVPNSTPVNLFFAFTIIDDDFHMLLTCQVGDDGVFNYTMEDINDNYIDYYIKYKDKLEFYILED